MRNEFTAAIERGEEWYIASCLEVPGAFGQGRTLEECRSSLAGAISLILEYRRDEALRGLSNDANLERIVVDEGPHSSERISRPYDKDIINPPTLAAPVGFNHGILVTGGRMLFLAGQDASDAEGRIVAPGDLLAQFEQVLRNLQAVVEAAGGTMRDIVKLNIYVTDRDAYRASLKPLGERFRAYFGNYYPAMALFEVSGLFQEEALIEMEGVAVIGASEAPDEL